MERFNLNSQFWVAAKRQKSVIEKQSYFLLGSPVGHAPHPNHQPIPTQAELSIHFNQSPHARGDGDGFNPFQPQVRGPQPCRSEDALCGQPTLALLQGASGPGALLQRQQPTPNTNRDTTEAQAEQ